MVGRHCLDSPGDRQYHPCPEARPTDEQKTVYALGMAISQSLARNLQPFGLLRFEDFRSAKNKRAP